MDPTHRWENPEPTRLIELPSLARLANVARVSLKLERDRPLGNFKVLGGMHAGLRALAKVAGITVEALCARRTAPESLPSLICASEGNHGLAVTAAAKRAGTRACIYLPASVSAERAERITALGGELRWVQGTYDDAVREAEVAARRGDNILIADTGSDPDDPGVHDVIDGYALITREVIAQLGASDQRRPSHAFVQAGVGGLAAAVAQGLTPFMGEPRQVVVVEPMSAACVAAALAAGSPVRISGELRTSAVMLACGVASAAALRILQRHTVATVGVTEESLQAAVLLLQAADVETTASGAAGLAGLLHVAADEETRERCRLSAASNVLLVVTEGRI